jgi:hypothetical protein
LDLKKFKKEARKANLQTQLLSKRGCLKLVKKSFLHQKSQEKLKRFMMIFFKNHPPELLLTMRYGPFEVVIYQIGPAVS